MKIFLTYIFKSETVYFIKIGFNFTNIYCLPESKYLLMMAHKNWENTDLEIRFVNMKIVLWIKVVFGGHCF